MGTALRYERSTALAVPPDAAFAWHARPGAFERLRPPWRRMELLDAGSLAEGARTRFRQRHGPLWIDWVSEQEDVRPPHGWSDVQRSGPFRSWRHEHRFAVAPDGGTVLTDRIAATLPTVLRPALGYVTRELERSFRYRHRVTAADLEQQARLPSASLHVAVSGASGFLGRLLVPLLTTAGHRVSRLVRTPPGAGEIQWDPAGAGLDPRALRGIDAVVHLAGENIARRWTRRRRAAIRNSRQQGTRLLAEAIALAPEGPRTFISASAVGYYGDRGDEVVTEASAPGTGFLPEVAQQWEAATGAAERAGVRVVRLRMGLPLSPDGGLLQRMLPPFRLGVGGRLGRGNQWVSWISADDLLGVFYHVLGSPGIRGAVNAVAPHPVRNRELTHELARVLRRPAFATVPRAALRLLFGAMADQAILASTRVAPKVLLESGYRFRHERVGDALAHVLGLP